MNVRVLPKPCEHSLVLVADAEYVVRVPREEKRVI